MVRLRRRGWCGQSEPRHHFDEDFTSLHSTHLDSNARGHEEYNNIGTGDIDNDLQCMIACLASCIVQPCSLLLRVAKNVEYNAASFVYTYYCAVEDGLRHTSARVVEKKPSVAIIYDERDRPTTLRSIFKRIDGRVVMACDSRILPYSTQSRVFSWALPAGVRIPLYSIVLLLLYAVYTSPRSYC